MGDGQKNAMVNASEAGWSIVGDSEKASFIECKLE